MLFQNLWKIALINIHSGELDFYLCTARLNREKTYVTGDFNHMTYAVFLQASDLWNRLSTLKEQYPVLLLTSSSLIRPMIGLDILGESCIRNWITNGLLSPRWQPVVWVYNLSVISTNPMNQITVKSIAFGIDCLFCPPAEENEGRRPGRG